MKTQKKSSNLSKEENYTNQGFENRLTRVEVTIENINETLIRFEKSMNNRFDTMDKRLDSFELKMDKGFDSLELKMDRGFQIINGRIWNNFYWIIGGFVGILGILAHAIHWI